MIGIKSKRITNLRKQKSPLVSIDPVKEIVLMKAHKKDGYCHKMNPVADPGPAISMKEARLYRIQPRISCSPSTQDWF
ncbi:hypothetical protein D3C87_2031820 [compost metagenome]